MKDTNTKLVEKEKIVAEKLNGRFAMMGFIALLGAYLTTGQIIPGISNLNYFKRSSCYIQLDFFLHISFKIIKFLI